MDSHGSVEATPGGARSRHGERRAGAARRSTDRLIDHSVELTDTRDAAGTSRDRLAVLAETSRVLAASLDYETTLAAVAGLSLPYLGAWCIVDVCAVGGDIRRLAVLHPDPARQAVARALHEQYPPGPDDLLGAPRVIRSGRPELVVEVSDATLEAAARDPEHLRLLRALGVGAYVVAPMVARGRVLGAITFVTAEAGRRYGDLDVTLAEDLASRAAMAMDNARLHAEALEARRAAEAATRAKGEFLAVMSHELRTPLQAVGGYADILALGVHGPLTAAQQHDLARIREAQEHLLGLIDEVLSYARLGSGAVTYRLTDVPVADVVGAAEGLVLPLLRAKGLSYAWAGCDPGLRVRADRDKLQQVLVNLLANAVKFTDGSPAGGRVGRPGRVEVACEAAVDPHAERGNEPRSHSGGRVRIRVRDTGEGIPPDKLEAVFEPFVQVGRALNRPGEGTGLGLAISRDLARGMGGNLTAESTPGAGSTFTLTLPAAVAPVG